MVTLHVESPVVMRLEGIDPSLHGMHFKYTDKRLDYELQKLQHSQWQKDQLGFEAWKEEIARLKEERNKSLLFEDGRGYWTYTGLCDKLKNLLHADCVSDKVKLPKPSIFPWAEKPFEMYEYQKEALFQLLQVRHGGVEIGTGLGKTLIITYLVKQLGLQTIVMAPSASIAGQIYQGFVKAFGKKYVGMYGDGKKEAKKLITVALAQSLTRVEEGTEAYEFFSKTQVFIADESHLTPASTFSHVCHGLVKSAPYRYFFSATQLRNDGLDLLLDAITGPVVFRMTVKQGIAQGYLAKQIITMVKVPTDSSYQSKDANELTRRHLYYNPAVNKKAGELANKFVENIGPVLILIDEFENFTHLLPYLRHKAAFAHSGVTKANKGKIPPEYHDSDPDALVAQFNAGKIPILIGTSCISTGTDIKGNWATIYLVGGKSEIAVMQGAVGRSTRKNVVTGKDTCHIVDFWITGSDIMERHAKARMAIYEQIAPVRVLNEEM